MPSFLVGTITQTCGISERLDGPSSDDHVSRDPFATWSIGVRTVTESAPFVRA
jgi:hypothetical protein